LAHPPHAHSSLSGRVSFKGLCRLSSNSSIAARRVLNLFLREYLFWGEEGLDFSHSTPFPPSFLDKRSSFPKEDAPVAIIDLSPKERR